MMVKEQSLVFVGSVIRILPKMLSKTDSIKPTEKLRKIQSILDDIESRKDRGLYDYHPLRIKQIRQVTRDT